MKLFIIAAVAAASLSACATNDYKQYADAQTQIQLAKSNAEAERFKAMAVIAATGDSVTKVAAMFALQSAGGSAPQSGAQIMSPKNPWDSAREWLGVLLPSVVQVYGINANASVAKAQSNNSRDVAVSTNSTFATIGASGTAAAANVAAAGFQSTSTIAGLIQAPAASNTTTTTNTNTLSGSGVLGTGTYSTTDNHSVVNDNHTVTPTPTVIPPVIGTPAPVTP